MPADIDSQIDVNLRGLIQVTRAVLPSMLARRSGTIINMSSVAGLIAAPMYSIYAATKYGVRGFTDALRREVVSFGMHVCGIYPGPAVTEFSQHTGSDSAIKKNLKTPGWIYMTSAYVARRTVGLAKHPRRTLIIPWWFRPIIGFRHALPRPGGLVPASDAREKISQRLNYGANLPSRTGVPPNSPVLQARAAQPVRS